MPSKLSSASAYIPYTLHQLSATCVASYGLQAAIFAPMSGRAEHVPKRKTAVKAIYKSVERFYRPAVFFYTPGH